jgi:hypothetical protein
MLIDTAVHKNPNKILKREQESNLSLSFFSKVVK